MIKAVLKIESVVIFQLQTQQIFMTLYWKFYMICSLHCAHHSYMDEYTLSFYFGLD